MASSLSPNLPLVVFPGTSAVGTSVPGISALSITGAITSAPGYSGSSAAPHFSPIHVCLVFGWRLMDSIYYIINFEC